MSDLGHSRLPHISSTSALASIADIERAGSERPPSADSGHSSYSMTSSARVNIRGEIVKPIAFAVLRLSTNSKLVPMTTGRSAGLSPLKISPA